MLAGYKGPEAETRKSRKAGQWPGKGLYGGFLQRKIRGCLLVTLRPLKIPQSGWETCSSKPEYRAEGKKRPETVVPG